jgi:hypothetical protein
MFAQLSKYVTVFLLSMVKFIGGPLTGTTFGLNWMETCLFTVLGMMTSVLIFSQLGKNARAKLMSRFYGKRKLFSSKNRRIVTVWRKYGLTGVAFLTPIIFSPIVGTIVAASFGESSRRIFTYMLYSAIFWGIVLSLLLHEIGGKVNFSNWW